MQGDHGHGAALLEEALAATQDVADRRLAQILAGRVLINLAVGPRAQGQYALAEEHLEAALRLLQEVGYTEGIILALGDLGNLARDQGDSARALALYHEALELGRNHPGTRFVTEVIEAVGIVAAAAGQAQRGARVLSAAGAQRERLGLRYGAREDHLALEHAVAATRAALGEPAFATTRAAGRALTPAQAIAEALAPLAPATSTQRISLTPREDDILRLLVAGQTDPAIAAALFISVRTVEHHVARIFAKLGVHTRTAAVTAAIATGLVDPTPPLLS
jgi:DNA-binding CsgD family transcriptional regulator